MNNRLLPDEILLLTFSFLGNKATTLSPLSRVCKDWQKVANKDALWLQLIRPEYQEACKTSGGSAKAFYINNIDARIDTYYLLGSAVKVIGKDWQDTLCALSEDNNSLLSAFPKGEKIKIFYSRENAIYLADIVSENDQAVLESDLPLIQNYTPIFRVQINDTNSIIPSQLNLQTTFNHYGVLDDTYHDCFEVPSSQIVKVYSLSYKTGLWGEEVKEHEITLNKNLNQKNPQKYHANVEEEVSKNKCSIQ